MNFSRVIFKKIRWKNFMSYGNVWTEIILTESQLNLIQGKVGSGKSSIFDALMYCLFNKPYRKVTLGQLMNSINGKALCVEVEFSVGADEFKVIRGQKPGIFEIYKNAELITEDSAKGDYQKFLEEKILGFGQKTFRQICIIGSAGYTQFMSLSTGDRRNMIEELLDLSIFSDMASLNKDDVSSTKKEIDTLDIKITAKKVELGNLNNILSVMVEENKNKKIQIREKLDTCKENLGELEEKKSLIPDVDKTVLLESLKKNTKKIDTIKGILQENVLLIGQSKKLLTFFSSHDVCPTCTQNIDSEFKESIIKKEEETQTKRKSASMEIGDKIKEVNTVLSAVQNQIEELQGNERSLVLLNNQIENVKTQIHTYEKDLVAEEKDTTLVSDKIRSGSSEVLSMTEKKSEEQGKHIIFTEAGKLLKDSGIKARFVQTYIPLINQEINKNLDMFDMFVNFELDSDFNETIKSRHRDAFTYESFSEGEKQKIDLAIMFTWREIAKRKNSVSCNLLCFDETTDRSLDGDSIDVFLEKLRSMEDTNTYIVTHRVVDSMLFDRSFQTKKNNAGYSELLVS